MHGGDFGSLIALKVYARGSTVIHVVVVFFFRTGLKGTKRLGTRSGAFAPSHMDAVEVALLITLER